MLTLTLALTLTHAHTHAHTHSSTHTRTHTGSISKEIKPQIPLANLTRRSALPISPSIAINTAPSIGILNITAVGCRETRPEAADVGCGVGRGVGCGNKLHLKVYRHHDCAGTRL